MYRRIKKILIVPLLIMTVLCCMLYTDYRKPMEVQAVVLTGDPFADLFGWALELVGFTGKNKESQDQALHNFVQYISKEINDLKSNTQAWTDNKILNTSAYETWKNSMAKKWSSMSEKERFMNCLNTYTEAEYRKSGTTDSYYAWLNETYVKSSTNPFEDVTECIPLNLLIAAAIRDGKISSKYTAEQWEQSGTFAILTMAVKDWLTAISRVVLKDAEAIWDSALALGQIVNTASLDYFKFYRFLLSDDFEKSVNYFPWRYSSSTKDKLVEARDYFVNNAPASYHENLKEIGSKYLLFFGYNSMFDYVFIRIFNIPDDTTSIKAYENGGSRQDIFYDSSGKWLGSTTYSTNQCTLLEYYGESSSENWMNGISFSSSSCLGSRLRNIKLFSLSEYSPNEDIAIVPFGLDDVSLSYSGYTYETPSSRVYDPDAADDDPVYVSDPFDVVKTGNGDLAADIAGTMIDVSDVQDIPTDEVIDLDVTETGVAAREQEDTDALDKAKDNAQTRLEEEAKPDVKDDVNSKDDDLDKYKIKVTDIFPFCIPFDIYRFFSCLAADPVAPKFTIPVITQNSFGIPEYSVEIDFSKFNSVAAILRKMEFLGFCVGLAFATNKLIKH